MTPARLKPNAIAPKIKEAVRHLLTQETFNFAEAARVAGTTTERLRDEMLRPHTRKYLREQRRAQIEAVIANNPTVLAAIRDRGKNEAARVRAAAVLEQSFIQANLETVGASQKLSPGLVIIVGGPNCRGRRG